LAFSAREIERETRGQVRKITEPARAGDVGRRQGAREARKNLQRTLLLEGFSLHEGAGLAPVKSNSEKRKAFVS